MGVQEQLEQADLEGLASHTADELLEHVLPDMESRCSYDDLYERWEKQHWMATAIDFTQDRVDWLAMPQVIRDQFTGTFAAFYQGEESVTRNLAPMLMAAPRLEHEVFLTTQTVDEARHMMFFKRVFNEVLGWEGDAADHVKRIKPYMGPWYSNLFFDPGDGLDGMGEKLRQNPNDVGLFAETVTLYHLVLETGLALVGQRFLLDLCRGIGGMPGFYKGFMAVTRDESRHVGFGVRVIRELKEADSTIGPRVLEKMYRHMPDAVRLLHPPDEDYSAEILDLVPPEAVMGPQNGHRYAVGHILKRLSAAGFTAEECNELGAFAWSEFEKALEEWESRTGGTHFARLLADDHAKGPARVA